MTEWEYKVIDTEQAKGSFLGRTPEHVEEYLNQFGAEGWEIVAMDYRELSGNLRVYCIAKRAK